MGDFCVNGRAEWRGEEELGTVSDYSRLQVCLRQKRDQIADHIQYQRRTRGVCIDTEGSGANKAARRWGNPPSAVTNQQTCSG